MLITSLASSLVHVVVNGFEELGNLNKKGVPLESMLLTSVSSDYSDLTLLKIIFTYLKSDGGSLEFPVIEFPSWVIVVTVIAS